MHSLYGKRSLLVGIGFAGILGVSLALWLTLAQGPQRVKPLPSPSFEEGPTDGYQGTRIDRLASDFRLMDQNGNLVTLAELRGRVVVLTFLDSRCEDVCPLTALHLRLAYERLRYLGTDVSKLVMLGINVNLTGNTLKDARAFTARYGLSAVPTWHFLIGPEAELRAVWQAYGVTVQTENVSLEEGEVEPAPSSQEYPDEPGHVVHSTGIYLIDPRGQLRWYLSTLLGEEGQLVATWEGPTPSDWLVARLRPMLMSLSPSTDDGEDTEEKHKHQEEVEG